MEIAERKLILTLQGYDDEIVESETGRINRLLSFDTTRTA
jgi:hypothetical protein